MTALVLTAELVAAATGTEQVGNVRGRVQHITTDPNLTPTGRLRRGDRPVCGQHARRWTVLTAGDPRPLCTRCTSWALRRAPHLPDVPYQQATPEQIRDALRTVTTPTALHRLVLAVCRRKDLLTAHVVFTTDPTERSCRLTQLVGEARRRLEPKPLSTSRRPARAAALPRRFR
jgi:hypothetical protein